MYPSSPLWKAHIEWSKVPEILRREKHNVPEAIKQVFILVTPGIGLALLLALRRMRFSSMRPESIWAWVVVFSTVSLILAYCMLVFDSRYILPIAPLLIVLGARFLWPFEDHSIQPLVNFLPLTLFIGSIIFLAFYHGSPFRSFRRDYQTGVYAISDALRQIPRCDRLVSLGAGPFPEQGVGWEAGIYASYFAQCRIIGFSVTMPSSEKAQLAASDIEHLGANSVLIFRSMKEEDPTILLDKIRTASHFSSSRVLLLSGDTKVFLLWNGPPFRNDGHK